ncbi:MAG: gamma-glutamylcyclotransferase [Myxococcales bacterium]|nr:gamma-glutamylcyclotransferase [Myxococcales bacterium]
MASGAWVFAYGSNADLRDLGRCFAARGLPPGRIDEDDARVAALREHRLVWNYHSVARDGGAANVEPAAGHAVYGLALRVDAVALAGLDVKEGHPERYRRSQRELASCGGSLAAWVYRVTPAFVRAAPVWPRRAYIELMIRAGERHGYPEWYVERLRRTPTLD